MASMVRWYICVQTDENRRHTLAPPGMCRLHVLPVLGTCHIDPILVVVDNVTIYNNVQCTIPVIKFLQFIQLEKR